MTASYSTREVAAQLGVSIQTVQRWVDSGQLRAWKTPGGHRRVDAASADAMVRAKLGAAPPPTAQTIHPRAPARLRALVVDDNEDDRELMALLVLKALPGAAVAAAGSGFEALIAIGREAPDLLITDVMMPNMNGVQMLSHLSADATARPRCIVATSSHSRAEIGALGPLPAGVLFVPKPVERPALAAWLRERLARDQDLRLATQ